MTAKILILRFSSFGDIVQAFPAANSLQHQFPGAEIHWAVRSDQADIVGTHPLLQKIWTLPRGSGFQELLKFARQLRAQKFTHVYDAHNNLRSRFIGLFLFGANLRRRSKERWKRWLLFKLGWNLFEKPYLGIQSYLKPIAGWGAQALAPAERTTRDTIPKVQLQFSQRHFSRVQEALDSAMKGTPSFVVLAPSAAWPMKRWPLDYWKQLAAQWTKTPLILVGGPEDEFLSEIASVAQVPVLNGAGRFSLAETALLISKAAAVVSADTGALHVADLLGVPTLALIGPTAFGFPSRKTSVTLEVPLACRPCSKDGRGRCRQSVYQKCLVDLTPEIVLGRLKELIS